MISDTTKRKLAAAAILIFDGLPNRFIGNNGYGDSPIVGPMALAQVVVNRVQSVTHSSEEFKYMSGVVMQYLAQSKGAKVEQIRLVATKETVASGLTDQHGYLLNSTEAARKNISRETLKKMEDFKNDTN